MGIEHLRKLKELFLENPEKNFTKTELRDILRRDYNTILDALTYLIYDEKFIRKIIYKTGPRYRLRIMPHKVKHVYSGKQHFFQVESARTKEDYDVSLQVSCTCKYMSVQGIANGKICQHILATMKKITEK